MTRLLLALALFAATAGAQERQLVAVLPLDVRQAQLDEPTRVALEESIRSVAGDVLSPRGFTVLTGDTTIAVLADNQVDATRICDASCALAAARELKAKVFVSGTVARTEGQYAAFIRLFDVSGTQLASVSLEAPTMRELRAAFEVKAEVFFSRALGAAPVAAPSPVVPGADLSSGVPTVLAHVTTTAHEGEFTVTIEHANGEIACPRPVTYLAPCDLKGLPFGPARVKVVKGAGEDTFSADVVLAEAVVSVVVNHEPATLRNIGIGLLAAGLIGLGVSLPILINEPEATVGPILGVSLGGGLTYVGIVLTPVGASIAGGSISVERGESHGARPYYAELGVVPIPGGAAFVAVGSF